MTIHLSEAAAKEIRRRQSSSQQPGSYFRLGVKEGGCCGLYYTLDLTEKIQERDCTYQSQGISILVDQQSVPYLQNLKLDYAEDLMGGGFRFENPQSSQTCSCGLSFAIGNSPGIDL